jgi:hypothetical protein
MMGCESLPGNDKSQGAVIGGLGGALAGAAVAGDDDRALGALIGGALGAGGGYLIGAQKGKMDDENRDEAIEAAKEAERNPAKAEDVGHTRTADINDDGFVTLDEVVAMETADLSDKEMIRRLERTQQYFELTESQQDYLREKGVSDDVITAMADMDPEAEARLANETQGEQRISRSPD